jgi:hypothetical protein
MFTSPTLVLILSQTIPVHTVPSYLSKIYFNIRIVHPPTSVWTLAVLTEAYRDFSEPLQENFGVMLVHYRFLSDSLSNPSFVSLPTFRRHILDTENMVK